MATYRPKNILITGAAGFIASHFANRLIRSYPDYKIVVLDKLDYCSNLKNLNPSKLSPNFKFVKGDTGSADLVNYLLITESIDTIMHFAAQTHVDNSFGNSFEFTMNNVYGTHVLLEACKVTGQIRRFIHVSTAEVYGETDEDAAVRILIFTHTKKEKSFATSFSALPCYQDSFSNILKIENYEAGYWIVPSGDG